MTTEKKSSKVPLILSVTALLVAGQAFVRTDSNTETEQRLVLLSERQSEMMESLVTLFSKQSAFTDRDRVANIIVKRQAGLELTPEEKEALGDFESHATIK